MSKLLFFAVFIHFLIASDVFCSFGQGTFVKMPNSPLRKIEDLMQDEFVESYTIRSSDISYSKVLRKNLVLEKSYLCIFIEDTQIIASKLQRFYLPIEKRWEIAANLKPHQRLLNYYGNYVEINKILPCEEPLDLVEITLNNDHNFFVSSELILVHNIPYIVIGFAWAFGEKAIEYLGTTALIGVAGMMGVSLINSKTWKQINIADKSPGKPTHNDGYKEPKNWDGKKRKHPASGEYGWPDKNGAIWVPTGEKGHGGPHWDVQYPDGSYDNVMPGGKIRG